MMRNKTISTWIDKVEELSKWNQSSGLDKESFIEQNKKDLINIVAVLKKYKLDWYDISQHQYLSEEFITLFSDKIHDHMR